MAAPRPGIHCCGRPGANRVEVDVTNQLQQIGVGIDEECLVPALKDVAGAALSEIDPLGVSEGDVPHDARNSNFRVS
jgi:hypothetical protein